MNVTGSGGDDTMLMGPYKAPKISITAAEWFVTGLITGVGIAFLAMYMISTTF